VASLDVGIALPGAGDQEMHPLLTGLLPLALASYLLAWGLVGWPVARLGRLPSAPLAIAFAGFVLTIFGFLGLGTFVRQEAVRDATDTLAGRIQLGVLTSSAVACGFLLYRLLATGAPSHRALSVGARISLAAPLAFLAFAIAVWVRETGILGLGAIVFFAIATLTIALVAFVAKSIRPLLALLYLGAVFAVAAPAWLAASSRPPASPAAQATVSGPRLVLLITVDALRRDALSIYSGGPSSTPAFDALARDGMIYENAFAPAPWTLPSLATLQTALPETVHDVSARRPRLPDGVPTLAGRLADSGYRTAAIGSNPWLEQGDLGRGFDDTFFYPQPRYRSVGSSLLGSRFGIAPTIDANTEELTDRAIAWLAEDPDVPAFLWLHYLDPHSPYEPPADLLDDRKGMSSFSDPYRVMSGSWQTRAPQKARIRELYDAEVRHVDRNLARLIAEVKARGLYEDALVAVVADHGEEFWDHDTGFHGHTFFDEMVRVPLIVKPPPGAFQPGWRIEGSVSTGSVAATLLASTAADRGGFESFFPRLPEGPADEVAPRTIVSSGTEYFERRRAVMVGTHKLIRHLDSERRELYDLSDDPAERCDRAVNEPERVAELAAQLDLHEARALAARRELGLATPDDAAIPERIREHLESLGYVQ
jgi:arylsulfatase